MDSDTSDLESEKDGAKDSQKVLIEKGGKFELVNASDMEAVCPGVADQDSSQTEVETVATGEEAAVEGPQAVGVKDSASTDVPLSSEVVVKESASSSSKNSNATDGDKKLKTSSQVRIVDDKSTAASPQKVKTLREKMLSTTGSSASMRQLASRAPLRKPAMERTKSAPGGRVASLLEQGEDDIQRRQRNEIAFTAWLNRKKEEYIRQQEQAKEQSKLTEEDLEQKKLRNETTFNSWIATKDRELQARRAQVKLQRPSTSIPKADSAVAYASWVERKNQRRRQHTQLVLRTHKQVEESASKSDTTVIDKAYKNWLLKKNAQAKEDAVRKEHYKRIYFKESKQLKQSLTSRFEGF